MIMVHVPLIGLLQRNTVLLNVLSSGIVILDGELSSNYILRSIVEEQKTCSGNIWKKYITTKINKINKNI